MQLKLCTCSSKDNYWEDGTREVASQEMQKRDRNAG